MCKDLFDCFKECFTKFWGVHKLVHAQNAEYNPWPSYKFTGTLRPYPLVAITFFFVSKKLINHHVCLKSKKRQVPAQIVRPDYADHPEGHPLSEIAERGSTNVKVLDEEEIEGLKLACKVILFRFLVDGFRSYNSSRILDFITF